jgi:hypothetical protein
MRATIEMAKTTNNALAQAFRDNLELDHAGIRGSELTPPQRESLIDVVAAYSNNMSHRSRTRATGGGARASR